MELMLTLTEADETSLKILAMHWQTTPEDAAVRAIAALAITLAAQNTYSDLDYPSG